METAEDRVEGRNRTHLLGFKPEGVSGHHRKFLLPGRRVVVGCYRRTPKKTKSCQGLDALPATAHSLSLTHELTLPPLLREGKLRKA